MSERPLSLAHCTVTRNVDATNARGEPCKIALATIIHENGTEQTIAIPEDKIRFEGEGLIEREVTRAIQSPTAPGLNFRRKPH